MKLLIAVDCQNDFITGALGSKETSEIIPTIQHKIDALETGDLLIFTQDEHLYSTDAKTIEESRLPRHCELYSYGSRITDELILDNCKCTWNIVRKSTFIYNTWEYYLCDFMDDIDEIEICGLCTDICVISNALVLRSLFPYTPIIVDAGACAGSTPQLHEMALQIMRANLIDIVGEIPIEKIETRENELYQEIGLFADGKHIGEAEVDLKGKMLCRLSIYPPYQNKGYGTKIVKMLTDKYKCDCLWVRADNNKAINVYKKNGYCIDEPTMYSMRKLTNE